MEASITVDPMYVTNFDSHRNFTDAEVTALTNHTYGCSTQEHPSRGGPCDCPLRSERRRLLLKGACQHCGSTGACEAPCPHSSFKRFLDNFHE